MKNFANALLKGWNSIVEKRENLSEDLKLGQGGWQVWGLTTLLVERNGVQKAKYQAP